MRNIFTIVLLILSIPVWGCINEYRTLLSGEVIITDPTSGRVWTKEINREELRKRANELWALYLKTDSIEYLSDYGASLIYLQEYDKAKKIYFTIERRYPGLYTTASNLGTLYELTGKPDSALIWIKKSLKINPESHEGSEWIHIKILQFKIKNSQYINGSLLGLDFGNTISPENPMKYDLFTLQEHIRHQLEERTVFVKPKDMIVGNLYFDYGNILAQTADLEAALESYEVAREYGFESELMNKRIELFTKLSKKAQFEEKTIGYARENFKTVSLVVIFTLGLISFIVIWVIKRKRKYAR